MRDSPSSPIVAFSRLEVIVLILVTGLIGLMVVPVRTICRPAGTRVPATKDVADVMMALSLYAGENGGLYPTGIESSNEAFRKLFPDYCEQEKIFWVSNDSVFCDPNNPPDEDISAGKVLEPGENHWAYVSGLDDAALSNTPIVMDGFTAPGYRYDSNHTWWKSELAIVIVAFVDGSAHHVALRDGVLTLADPENPGKCVPIEQSPSLKGKTILNPERHPSKQ